MLPLPGRWKLEYAASWQGRVDRLLSAQDGVPIPDDAPTLADVDAILTAWPGAAGYRPRSPPKPLSFTYKRCGSSPDPFNLNAEMQRVTNREKQRGTETNRHALRSKEM